MLLPPIVVTSENFDALSALLERSETTAQPILDRLDDELARAEIVPASEIEADVVTMSSQVLFQDVDSGVSRSVTLVYPPEADVADNRVSVLAPVGSALLGLRVGQTIDWTIPGERVRRYRIEAVTYQPEAAAKLGSKPEHVSR